VEDDRIGAWDINISERQDQFAQWWILSNKPTNQKKAISLSNP
jgi:hypothetical protein